jgi:hypothetical protein
MCHPSLVLLLLTSLISWLNLDLLALVFVCPVSEMSSAMSVYFLWTSFHVVFYLFFQWHTINHPRSGVGISSPRAQSLLLAHKKNHLSSLRLTRLQIFSLRCWLGEYTLLWIASCLLLSHSHTIVLNSNLKLHHPACVSLFAQFACSNI